MSNDDTQQPKPHCSMKARADAMQKSNIRYARALGQRANLSSVSGDFVQILIAPPVLTLDQGGVPFSTLDLNDIKRDPITLEVIADNPLDPKV